MKKFSTLMIVFVASITFASAAIVEGTCGDNLTWSLNTQDSTLTIEGSGEMNWDKYAPWEEYRSYIAHVSLPNGLTNIKREALSSCYKLTSVEIPNSVINIENYAFSNCFKLTSVTFGNSIENIGYGAFSQCKILISIDLPNSLKSIGGAAFSICNKLTSVTIPNSVTSIGERAFSECSALISVNIGNSVKSIGKSAFYKCGSLASINIPNSVTSIGSDAFSYCYSLTSVTIPSNVTSIGNFAFSYCSCLNSIACEAITPPSIGEYTFTNFSAILYVPSTSIDAYQNAIVWEKFTNVQSLDDQPCIISSGTCGEDLKWELYCDSSLVVKGSGYMDDYNETSNISPWKDNLYVGYLYLPEYLENIGQYAFTGCASLKAIYIPDNVKTIGWAAFRGCEKLTEVQFRNGVSLIQNEAFQYCRNIKELNLPASLSEIANWAFSECTGLTQITCNVTNPPEIYKYTFDHVDKHIPLYVPEESVDAYKAADHWKDFLNILSIEDKPCLISSGKCGDLLSWELTCDSLLVIRGEGAMTNWTSENEVPWSSDKKKIAAVSLPSGLTNIGDFAFYECRALKSMTIPNSITSIGNQSIRYCDSITTVTIGSGVASIGSWAFNGDSLQTAFVVDDNNSHFCDVNGVLFTNDLSLLVQYPVGRANSEYIIPDGVVNIASGAFSYSKNLNSVTIPASVSEIESYAFFMCKNINTLTCKSVTPPSVGYNGFYAIDRSIPVCVHRKSMDSYQSAEVWEEFTNIQAIPTLCTISYTDKDASIIDTEDMILHLPEPPIFTGFTFVKWQVLAGDIADGITIQAVYTADEPTSAPEVVTNPSNPAQKLIRNGNVYILTDDKTYTLTGQQVR